MLARRRAEDLRGTRAGAGRAQDARRRDAPARVQGAARPRAWSSTATSTPRASRSPTTRTPRSWRSCAARPRRRRRRAGASRRAAPVPRQGAARRSRTRRDLRETAASPQKKPPRGSFDSNDSLASFVSTTAPRGGGGRRGCGLLCVTFQDSAQFRTHRAPPAARGGHRARGGPRCPLRGRRV